MQNQRCRPLRVFKHQAAPRGAVYPRRSGVVNRRRWVGVRSTPWLVLVPVVAGGLPCPGCATPPPTTVARHLIAVRYDVEPVIVREGRNAAAEAIPRDFQEVAKLGFNGVVLRHLDASGRETVLEAARAAGLAAVLPLRRFKHFVTTGTFPAGSPNLANLVRAGLEELEPPVDAVPLVVDAGSSTRAAKRSEALCEMVQAGGGSCFTTGAADATGSGNALAVIATAGELSNPEESPLEAWLAGYHRGLLLGRTAGLVLNRYRRLIGDPPGLATHGRSPDPARASAIRELITRARRWGPRLHRFVVEPLTTTPPEGLKVRVAVFARARRQYVLVFNPSSGRYARGEIALPETINGTKPERAIEVPPSEAKPAGRVFYRQRGRIVLPVALRPGDAALFELF